MTTKKLALVFMIVFSPMVLSEETKEGVSDIGRYQVSTTYREAGNWVFVTVIDTKTGQIVKQERYNGFKQYTQK